MIDVQVSAGCRSRTVADVDQADLQALLEIAREQADCVDEDEAAGYGLTLADTERLCMLADRLLAVLA